MIQQQITYFVEGWSPIGKDGAYARKETTAVQTLDGVIQALRYLAAVQGYACFTVSTRLVSIDSMLGEVNEELPTPETPSGTTSEIQV